MNFALILFVLMVLTFVAWIADRIVFRPRRLLATRTALEQFDRDTAPVLREEKGDDAVRAERLALRETTERQPVWLEYTAGLFPVIMAVFVLRSFVAEPFKIPSGSMIPTLLVGDLILVNKYAYGIRLPVIHTKIIDVGSPARGDVMVFRYPRDPSIDYIKRVVGLPGDRVEYRNKRLKINGVDIPLRADGEFFDEDRLSYSSRYLEKLGDNEHKILTELNKTSLIAPMVAYPFRERCAYHSDGVTCTVPPGHYFMMGDNRENSLDSRFWGFVPEENIVGKAFFVWMNFSDLKRIGSFK
ncbi:MAG: signal peptidase I [Burkholderiaceae bacterium]|nr:signal peptidase I [Burkholderiaceae bacterium]